MEPPRKSDHKETSSILKAHFCKELINIVLISLFSHLSAKHQYHTLAYIQSQEHCNSWNCSLFMTGLAQQLAFQKDDESILRYLSSQCLAIYQTVFGSQVLQLSSLTTRRYFWRIQFNCVPYTLAWDECSRINCCLKCHLYICSLSTEISHRQLQENISSLTPAI